MQNLFATYLQSISSKFSHEETSEMGYRTDFEILIKGIFESINVRRIDHDARATQGNKPDFVVLNYDVPILYIEAKDIGVSLDKVEKSEQMARYYGYANLVLTDYAEFRFYRNGLRYEEPIKIANFDIKKRTITSIPGNYEHVAKTLVDFSQSHKEPIRSGEHLAKIMGGKAQRIRDNVRQFFSSELDKNTDLIRLYETIKKLLVHDLTPNSFADMYAQTLVYGLFIARFYDKSDGSFSRKEARDLIPNSNRLLRHFFDHIVGADFDNRLKFIVDELCEVFSHADVAELMKEYYQNDLWGKTHSGPDPVIHFYEDFLKEYDPDLRKKMGAYYTPQPVVQFIVRSVDSLLKKEFGLAAGLADTSKTTNNIHRVQVLDPAVGTGTFISAVIRIIYEGLLKSGQKGRWPTYVHNDLLPRLFGFELMMAPYTIAHLKLGIAFKQTGFWDFHRRLGIYLTNSLEESSIQQDLFAFGLAESIAEESKEASVIKNKMPIMVVIGNPPYSGESSNKNYRENDAYKVEPAGGKLRERNSKWLNDDYVKFIRFAESMIEKTGEGIVAMITAHGYLDNPTFRGMRFHLMQTFGEIYVLDLHGNANKKEKAPDGSNDKNIFDIKQGVAIFFGIKKKEHKGSKAEIFRADCFGVRQFKFEFLDTNSVDSVEWKNIMPSAPNYEWVVRDIKTQNEYERGFSIAEIFIKNSACIVSGKDNNFIKFNREEFKKDNIEDNNIKNLLYRIFDIRCINYDLNLITRARFEIMRNFMKENVGLTFVRNDQGARDFSHIFVSNTIVDGHLHPGLTYTSPLYFYNEDGSRIPNLKKEIVGGIERIVGPVSPEDIFDYIYAVLHSPSYRQKYKEFLKIDFPRAPYPNDLKSFKELVLLGAELRSLHLLESPKVRKYITTYSVDGSNIVEKPIYKDGKVFINNDQYFGKVPISVWNFYIGGYRPVQEWLKDRKGRILINDEIEHYQKMIVALAETEMIMKEIDKFDLGNRS